MPLAKEHRLQVGQLMHDKQITMEQAMEKYNITRSMAYTCQLMYRKSQGIDSPGQKAARSRKQKRQAKAVSENPGVSASNRIVISMNVSVDQVIRLEAELKHAHEEIEILQKVIMALGKAL